MLDGLKRTFFKKFFCVWRKIRSKKKILIDLQIHLIQDHVYANQFDITIYVLLTDNYNYNASRMIYHNIFQLILSNSKVSQNTIHNFMSKLNIFNVNISGQPLTHDHPIILLYHQLIPEDLIASFKHFKIRKKIYEHTLLQLIYSFFSYLHLNIWKDRSTLFKIWKSTHDINKTDFKNYNKIHRSSHQPTNKHTQNNQPHVKDKPQLIKTPLNDHNRPNDPQEDWIIWTSSNFIHNLPWYHCLHKDIAYSPSIWWVVAIEESSFFIFSILFFYFLY